MSNMPTHTAPTTSELVRKMRELDEEKAIFDDKVTEILMRSPHKDWIKDHPIVTVKNAAGQTVKEKYIPSNIKRNLMRFIFGEYYDEIKQVGVMFNSCYAIVRVWYWNSAKKEYCYVDGCGAVAVQLDKDANASDLKSIKSDGVMKALPAAAEYAFNNACKKLGKIFGSELNKGTTAEFAPVFASMPFPDSEPAGIAAPVAAAVDETINF